MRKIKIFLFMCVGLTWITSDIFADENIEISTEYIHEVILEKCENDKDFPYYYDTSFSKAVDRVQPCYFSLIKTLSSALQSDSIYAKNTLLLNLEQKMLQYWVEKYTKFEWIPVWDYVLYKIYEWISEQWEDYLYLIYDIWNEMYSFMQIPQLSTYEASYHDEWVYKKLIFWHKNANEIYVCYIDTANCKVVYQTWKDEYLYKGLTGTSKVSWRYADVLDGIMYFTVLTQISKETSKQYPISTKLLSKSGFDETRTTHVLYSFELDEYYLVEYKNIDLDI